MRGRRKYTWGRKLKGKRLDGQCSSGADHWTDRQTERKLTCIKANIDDRRAKYYGRYAKRYDHRMLVVRMIAQE